MLSPNTVADLCELYPCRQLQIQQLSHLLSQWAPSPPAIVVHGLEATCKSTLVQEVLSLSGVAHAIVQSRECITGRHLLERTVAACIEAVEASSHEAVEAARYGRCENLAALAVHLQMILEGKPKFVLVFDGIDHQREAPPTLLSAIARFNEIIPNLTVVFIITFPRQRFLHTSGTVHIHFSSYTRQEALEIVSRDSLPIFNEPISPSANYSEQAHAEDKEWLWTRFCAAVWDSLARSTTRDVVSFRALAEKLWTSFVAPIIEGSYGTRDFSKLMVAKRALFQSEDLLVEKVVPKIAVISMKSLAKVNHDLSYYAKYLLCAAYLASYNPSRTDATFFMKSSEKGRKKKGGGTAKGRPAKHRKISRRLLHPSPFPLERLLAIFYAVLPGHFHSSAAIYSEIAHLRSCKLLLCSAVDTLDPAGSWKLGGVGLETVVRVGRSLGFEIEDLIAL